MRRMSRLSSDDCRVLLELARRAISSAVIEKRILDFSPYPTALAQPAGAFVTLHRDGRLRGCVGQVEASDPLGDAVARAAINAALHDSRFPAVEADEVKSLEIEISVLSPPESMAPETILPGRHGLLIVKGEHRGLLLPQVAAGRRWSSQRFLEETCAKAGLPRDAWRDPATRVFAFTAEVFSDSSLRVGHSVGIE
jgi:AmmeMemoRadiSam system protein A